LSNWPQSTAKGLMYSLADQAIFCLIKRFGLISFQILWTSNWLPLLFRMQNFGNSIVFLYIPDSYGTTQT
jgi:hypothetical protein